MSRFRPPRGRHRSLAGVARLALGAPKDPRAQLQGATARKEGLRTEAVVAEVCAWYDRRGEGLIEKVNAPTAGWGDTLRVGKATVDFTGYFWEPSRVGGPHVRRMVAFDVKNETGEASYAHDPDQYHQLTYLANARDRHGFDAFLLVYCNDLGALWMLRDLDQLLRRERVPLRTKHRATKAAPARVEHHRPVILCRRELGATLDPKTRRPFWDFLSLL